MIAVSVEVGHHLFDGADHRPMSDSRDDFHIFRPQILDVQVARDLSFFGVPYGNQALGHGRCFEIEYEIRPDAGKAFP